MAAQQDKNKKSGEAEDNKGVRVVGGSRLSSSNII
jgi:hypothetical protein